jgi:hypothetical protein
MRKPSREFANCRAKPSSFYSDKRSSKEKPRREAGLSNCERPPLALRIVLAALATLAALLSALTGLLRLLAGIFLLAALLTTLLATLLLLVVLVLLAALVLIRVLLVHGMLLECASQSLIDNVCTNATFRERHVSFDTRTANPRTRQTGGPVQRLN